MDAEAHLARCLSVGGMTASHTRWDLPILRARLRSPRLKEVSCLVFKHQSGFLGACGGFC